jgi:hypothetical protein
MHVLVLVIKARAKDIFFSAGLCGGYGACTAVSLRVWLTRQIVEARAEE